MTTFARSPFLSPAHMLLKQDHAAGLWESTDSLLCLLLCRWSQKLHLYLHLPVRGQQLVVMAACYLPTLLPRHCHGCSHDHQYAQDCSCVIHLGHMSPSSFVAFCTQLLTSHVQPHTRASSPICSLICSPLTPSPLPQMSPLLMPGGLLQTLPAVCLVGHLFQAPAVIMEHTSHQPEDSTWMTVGSGRQHLFVWEPVEVEQYSVGWQHQDGSFCVAAFIWQHGMHVSAAPGGQSRCCWEACGEGCVEITSQTWLPHMPCHVCQVSPAFQI